MSSPPHAAGRQIANFGRNVRFHAQHYYAPQSEAEVLEILDRHAEGKIRVVASLHSWSDAVVCQDAIVDMRHFDAVETAEDEEGTVWVTAGAGCQIKHLLTKLHAISDVTMPTLGLITEQTIAGAMSTGTHGSGRSSIAHYIAAVRCAAYDPTTGKARVYEWTEGPQLQAARCSLGCLGVILSVRFRGAPKYDVVERAESCDTLEEALSGEAKFPLQQFYLIPWLWRYYVQRRRGTVPTDRGRLMARVYRAYLLLGIDIGFHLAVKLLLLLRSRGLTRFFYRRLFGWGVLTGYTVIDRGDKMLVMEHELFRHVETEIFVPARHLGPAASLVRDVLEQFAGVGKELPEATAQALESVGLREQLESLRGSFQHHYPIAFRRVLPDDTLISMACGNVARGDAEPYYALSFITYEWKRFAAFYPLADFLARSMAALYDARPHWGKHFPLGPEEVQCLYPRLEEFRQLCQAVDPRGVFRNEYVETALGFK